MSTLNGDSTNNVLTGTSSSDTISGGAGSDTISGGSGSDYISGGSGSDYISGGSGSDIISGGSGNDVILAGSGNDIVSGGSGSDYIDGGTGNDLLSGGSGSDVLVGGSGSDVLLGGSGSDVLIGGTGNDLLEGGSGNDILIGGSGQDVLMGSSGDDVLIGLEGADWMQGGSGNDIFVYERASDSNSCAWDRIVDFQQGKDKIDLSKLCGATTNLAWGGKIPVANGVWYVNLDSSTIICVDNNNDGKADLKIELKNACGLELTCNDFIGVVEGNNAPVLSVDASGGATEDAANATLTDSGTLSFTDADVNDTHTVSAAYNNDAAWTGGSLTTEQVAAITSGFSADSDSWDYSVANAALQFLGAGETITFSFDVTVTDDSGAGNNSDTETVTLTLTGTNDQPTLTISDTAGALTEGDGSPTLSDSGALSFADLDMNDAVAVSQTYNDDIVWSGGSLISDLAQHLVAGFSVDQNSWDYNSSENLDFLGEGQTITFSYNVVATDHSHAGNDTSVAEKVTITLTGTNDAPVAEDDVPDLYTVGGASGNVVSNDDDVDAGDKVNLVVTAVKGKDGVFTTEFVGEGIEGTHGIIVFNDNTGTWGYTAFSDATDGDDIFEYVVDDGKGGSDVGILTIHVTGNGAGSSSGTFTTSGSTVLAGTDDTGTEDNDAGGSGTGGTSSGSGSGGNTVPVAVADEANWGNGGISGNVLANDVDPDLGDSLVVTSVDGNPDVLGDLTFGDYGFLVLADTGDWTYQLTAAGTDVLAQGGTADDVFDYTIADASGAAASSTLTVHIGDFIL